MTTKRTALIVGGFILFFLVVKLFFQTLVVAFIGGVGGGVIGALVALYVSKKERDRTSKEAEKAAAAKRFQPAEKLKTLLEKLVHVNTLVRTEGLSRKAISTVEAIIDMLRNLLPEMNENYRGNDLTWEVNRAAEVYLGNSVGPYVRLTIPEREGHENEFVESLGKLEDALKDISRLVRENRVGEFSAKAKFLRARFATSS